MHGYYLNYQRELTSNYHSYDVGIRRRATTSPKRGVIMQVTNA